MILDEQNVRAVAGDTVPLTFGPVLNSDGTFMNLRGGAARWALGSFRGAAGALLRKATGDGGIVIVEGDSYGRPTFTVAVMLDPGDTRGLRPRQIMARVASDRRRRLRRDRVGRGLHAAAVHALRKRHG